MNAPLTLFLIAGEPSGDKLGAALMAGLRDELGPAVRFMGVGGPLMEGQGLTSLVPIDRLSVMGIAEVVPRLPEILRLIRQTGDAVVAQAPDALITIDSPDFCLRVARRARARCGHLKTVHYVAPSVWAWRAGRAAKMARVIDHVLALLPFEPPYMTAAGMSCDFVGHPVVEAAPVTPAAQAALRTDLGIAPGQPMLCLLPGSRAGEVARHGPVFAQALAALRERTPDLATVIPAVGARVEAIRAMFPDCAILDPRATDGKTAEELKRTAFAASTAALAVSGTVSLELAAAGTPMIVAYKANPFSFALARRLVKVRFASLVNILEDAPVIPEFLQEAATAPALAAAVGDLLDSDELQTAQKLRFDASMVALGRGGPAPGLRAARSVLKAIE